MPFWNNGIHGGFAPGGIGDLNNDGYNDLVMPSGWYENPGKKEGESWLLHRWKQYGVPVGIPHTLYGTSIRSVIYDFNNDGNNDIVYTDCDGENSKAYIIFNINQGSNFMLTPLPFPEGPSGSLHSLGIADFNGDGLMDIFSGEQEDDDQGMKPLGLAERGFVWVNTGTANYPKFENVIIHTGNPGWHDTILCDMDNDGDTDLVTKVWNADMGEDGSRKWHISLWRNDSKRH
ncbi:MAG: VCBS repeat-containing protein [Bacteroidales bacterium]|nr:VCBS repeat-containing protein [Bacteroidales bacterium]